MTTPEMTEALELIKRGCEMIAAQEGGSAEAKQLKAAAVLVQEASEIAKTIPNAGESVELRWRIYQMIQSQAESDNAALYKELRCPIHLGLAGENSDPVTLPCGHTFCKTCIAGLFGPTTTPRKCPQCRADITVSYASLKTNLAIKGIVAHLLPRGHAYDPAVLAAAAATVAGPAAWGAAGYGAYAGQGDYAGWGGHGGGAGFPGGGGDQAYGPRY